MAGRPHPRRIGRDRSKSLREPLPMAKPNPLPPAQPEAPADDATDALNPEAEAAPEPITPERALEWNRYYDRYVVGGVLLLIFLVSAHKIAATNSSIWTHLKAGEVTVRNGAPIT